MEDGYSILVPTDFSGAADKALEAGINLARLSKAKLDVLHIEDVPADWVSIVENADRNLYLSINQRLDRIKDHLAERTQHVRDASVEVDDFLEFNKGHRAILGHAENRENDLIVMGAHGIGGIQGLMIGSYTRRILHSSHKPILVTKQADPPFWPKKMVFVSDFAEKHKNRFLVVIDFVQKMGLELHLLSINTPMIFKGTAEMEERMGKYLALAPEGFISKASTYNHIHFEDALKEYCHKYDIDLVSMISYNKRHAWRVLGSSIQGIINHLNIPVLAIPER
ncbi:MAG: universal stress protein [Roseivirga sp.]|nr:universal stress protein [Roseivirga sp.]